MRKHPAVREFIGGFGKLTCKASGCSQALRVRASPSALALAHEVAAGAQLLDQPARAREVQATHGDEMTLLGAQVCFDLGEHRLMTRPDKLFLELARSGNVLVVAARDLEHEPRIAALPGVHHSRDLLIGKIALER